MTRSAACSTRSRRRPRPRAGARHWSATSCLLLQELGFGLDPGQLHGLPAFLSDGGQANWADIGDGLELTGHFLDRDLLTGRAEIIGGARDRLVEKLRRAGGL